MTNIKESNVYKLFNTVLPSINHYDNDGSVVGADYYVDIAENVRLTFEYSPAILLLNGKGLCEIDEEVAGELLKLVRSLGYAETHTKGV